jgi:hypothetical protein
MQVNGWTKVHIAVLDDPRLSWEAELVWIIALSYTRPDRPDCWPSLPELAKWTGLSEWEVRKAIEGLAYGELDRYERWKRAARWWQPAGLAELNSTASCWRPLIIARGAAGDYDARHLCHYIPLPATPTGGISHIGRVLDDY